VILLARVMKNDPVDSVFNGLGRLGELAHRALSATETGRLRWYAAGIAAGSLLFLAIVLLS